MVKINTCHIGDEPMPVDGTESSDILDFVNVPGAPEMAPVSDIVYHLLASKTGQDLLVSGTASFQLSSVCSRCLKPVTLTVTADKLCLFYEKVPEQEVDITGDLREELLLCLPDYIRCSEDCKGLCPKCGADLNEGPCACDGEGDEAETPSGNSPWSVLDGLK